MSITSEIFQTWRHPAQAMARRLAQGPREDRAIAVLMGACLLAFVAQWPRLAREAHFNGLSGQPGLPDLQALMGINLFALLFIAPLALYAVAGLSQLLLRLFGVRVSGYGARIALFWALLATAPLMLLQGLVAGFVGPGPGLHLLGVLVGLGFLWLWLRLLRAARQ
ncbi:YIP1 family protein [Pseudogemmobacter sonorensis]|uniref:YIP1 family protein n=1 Tax=Pseudogemmobacter sonorensis TaxID=2989681 RepID=UPI0036CC76E1